MSETTTAKPATEQVSWVDRRWFQRLLEILPGTISWLMLIAPIPISIMNPIAVAYFIIAFDLYWMMKSFRLSANLIRGYRRLHLAQTVNWNDRLTWLKDPNKHLVRVSEELSALTTKYPRLKWAAWSVGGVEIRTRYRELKEEKKILNELSAHQRLLLNPDQIYNVVILATYNESLDILEPSIQAMTEVDYPLNQLMLVIAYEERGGETTETNAKYLIEKYGHHFALAQAIKHPDGLPGEARGKGANISYAGKILTEELREKGIHPERVIVTTFDSDHRASANYFSCLSFAYASDPNRVRKSFQPIPMFYNNIWDAPAPMRVIATGNSFWLLMETMRPHRLRNFAAHAQSLAALIATDFWSRTSIVEDGHQFWRTYFAYDGDHSVVPLYSEVYQDAVLADNFPKTIRAQYKQIRRWAWGVSDIPYVVRHSIANTRIPWSNKLVQLGRLFEGHFSWAAAPLLLAFVGYLPLVFSPRNSIDALPHQLPIITSHIMQISSFGLVITIFISMISLPPRPARYRKSKNVFMVLQWVLLPVTSIVFGSFAALESQTRLMLGKYLGFYVTEKARKK